MFARRSIILALVDVDTAIDSFVAGRTLAERRSVGRIRMTDGGRMTRIAGARIFELAQQTGAPFRADAGERSDTVDTNAVGRTGCGGTIVNVDRTVGTGPSVHANAIVSTVRVDAGGAILARIASGRTFVDVLSAKSAGKIGRAFAMIKSSETKTKRKQKKSVIRF